MTNKEDWIICPNCKGKGKVFDHAMGILVPIVGYLFQMSEFLDLKDKCRHCGGKGYIKIK